MKKKKRILKFISIFLLAILGIYTCMVGFEFWRFKMTPDRLIFPHKDYMYSVYEDKTAPYVLVQKGFGYTSAEYCDWIIGTTDITGTTIYMSSIYNEFYLFGKCIGKAESGELSVWKSTVSDE